LYGLEYRDRGCRPTFVRARANKLFMFDLFYSSHEDMFSLFSNSRSLLHLIPPELFATLAAPFLLLLLLLLLLLHFAWSKPRLDRQCRGWQRKLIALLVHDSHEHTVARCCICIGFCSRHGETCKVSPPQVEWQLTTLTGWSNCVRTRKEQRGHAEVWKMGWPSGRISFDNRSLQVPRVVRY